MFVVVVIKPLHARFEALVHGLAHCFAPILKRSAIAFEIRFRAFDIAARVVCALLNERNHLRYVASARAFFDTVHSTREFFAAAIYSVECFFGALLQVRAISINGRDTVLRIDAGTLELVDMPLASLHPRWQLRIQLRLCHAQFIRVLKRDYPRQ